MYYSGVRFTVLAIVLYMAGTGVPSQAADCQHAFQGRCVEPVEELLPRDAIFLFPTEDKLKAFCTPVLSVMRCAVEFEKDCPSSTIGLEAIRTVDELIPFAEEICDEESDLRKRYREHIGCISDIKENIINIISDSHVQLYDFVYSPNISPLEKQTYKFWTAVYCTSSKYIVGKLLALTLEECDVETTTFVAELLSRIVNPYEVMCPDDDEEIQKYITFLEQSI